MDIFLKTVAAVMITVVLYLVLSKRDKDISLLLTVAVCCMIMVAALSYLDPVLSFFRRLQSVGNLDSDILGILMKSVGIGLLAEISGMICSDVGNAALGKAIQIMAAAVILCISLPLFSGMLDLVAEIMGEI